MSSRRWQPIAAISRRPLGQTGAVQLVTLDDIRAAAELIRPYIVRTPLVPAGWADDERPLWIKPESLQQIGAFKVRGAFNAIANLDESVRTRGVVAYSSGNHAQAVAYAAAIYGVPAHIVMPRETPDIKVAATRSHGAEVVLCGAGEREKVAAQLVEQTGGILVPPFDHRDIIAGQGTIGLEIAEDLPDVATVLVPWGGGGLACGIATALREAAPQARILAAEVSTAAPYAASLAAGAPATVISAPSFVDGIGGPTVFADMFAHATELGIGSRVASVDEVGAAVRLLVERAKTVAEGAGATPVACALADRGNGTAQPKGPVVCVVSGGVIDLPKLVALLSGPDR